ncbi:ATP/GTP-binding protein [Streptomyces diastaticus]|uniref:ATP/GTP-binding protein n=1 Tax=Streptomyces diastaticus subsp. diastaticus TaxID=68040 RepID=A0ABQ1CRR0_STRDI|nr:ATP/GTP-binding protein [Streptomyces diastaticus]GFH72879.1 hypothetical protein Sdia_36470 [Streptomyces diastaticus subsp. diastaticus]GGU45288.1 hypothetical protein GCM10015534_54800 [Streptomyces diastaticus subsp. diastaticus]
MGTSGTVTAMPVADGVVTVLSWLFSLLEWGWDNVWWWAPLGAVLAAGGYAGLRRLADHASQERTAVMLKPRRGFEPSPEEIHRYGIQLLRASGAGPWWVPRRARTVRIRFHGDGVRALTYTVEAPAGAALLLRHSPFGEDVEVSTVPVGRRVKGRHRVRAEFMLRGGGPAETSLREVPAIPDPLQPLVNALSDMRADLHDVAEVCFDVQRPSPSRLRLKRNSAVNKARSERWREAARASRWQRMNAGGGFAQAWSGRAGRPAGGSLVLSPEQVDRKEALGKLADETPVVRVQVLVRCSSDIEGRARARLQQIQAAMDVSSGSARWSMRGWRFGPVAVTSDHQPWRGAFDHRWQTGQAAPPSANWVAVEELAGWLKPLTVHTRMPLLEGEVPTFQVGNPGLVLQGWYRSVDGRRRLLATVESETLFEVAIGKAGWGKTERALCQAVGLAHSGRGLAMVDPHGDTWARAAPYLAHQHIAERALLIDLADRGAKSPLAAWNPLSVHDGTDAHRVVADTVDTVAHTLGWSAATAPRGLTIFTQAVRALVAVNEAACRAGSPECQTTLFQMDPLFNDAGFRDRVLARLPEDERKWWQTVFPTLPADAASIVLNPISRLASDPVSRAFLGQPVGSYQMRRAMDEQQVMWIMPQGGGPTSQLITTLILRDIQRAAYSRRDTPAGERVPFRLYLDELRTLLSGGAETVAQLTEEARKFGLRLHGMSQLLQRLPEDVRDTLLQNASTLSSTAGSTRAISLMTAEWGELVSPGQVADLARYRHYMTMTVRGERVGPVLVEGPVLEEVFKDQERRQHVPALNREALRNAGAQPRGQLLAQARDHQETVRVWLSQTTQTKTPQLKGYR